MKRHWQIMIILFLIFNSVSYANDLKKTAQTAMKWLSIPVGAKAMGLGTAYHCYNGSAGDIFWNPAGTAFISSQQLYVTHLPWIADVDQEAIAYSYPLGGIGVLTASARYVNYGTLVGTQFVDNMAEIFEYTGDFTPFSYQIGLGFSQQIRNTFAYGLNVSYVSEYLGDVYTAPVGTQRNDAVQESADMSLINLDFGIIYYTGFKDLRVGMSLRNFSQENGYGNIGNSLPMDLRFGMAMNMLSFITNPDESNHKLNFSWDLSHPRDYTERIHLGVEYILMDIVSLRTGYKFNYDEENISYGFGLVQGIGGIKLLLDYAYLPYGVFDAVQAFSISLNL